LTARRVPRRLWTARCGRPQAAEVDPLDELLDALLDELLDDEESLEPLLLSDLLSPLLLAAGTVDELRESVR
jgi:hypothetical protein